MSIEGYGVARATVELLLEAVPAAAGRWVDTEGLRRALVRDGRVLGRWLPAAVFIPITIPLVVLLLQGWIAGRDWPGNDANLYRSAAAAWLAGGDPWLVGDANASFAGSPLTVLAFVPAMLIPEAIFRPAAVLVSWAAGAWLIRHFRLPWYWLAFPPLVAGAMLANPGVIAIALVCGPLAWLGSVLKVFMVVPTVGDRRWHSLVGAALVGVVSVLAFPSLWATYLRDLPMVSARLLHDLHYQGTLFMTPWLIPIGLLGLLALARVDLRAACWLAVPALWPAAEYHYGVFLMPAGAPVLGIFMAIGSSPVATAAIAVYGFGRFAIATRSGQRWRERYLHPLTRGA